MTDDRENGAGGRTIVRPGATGRAPRPIGKGASCPWTPTVRQLFVLMLLAAFSSGAIVGTIMWLAIQVFHP